MLDRRAVAPGEEIGMNGIAGENFEGERRDELRRRAAHHHAHGGAAAGEETNEQRRLIGGDAARNHQKDSFAR